MSLYTIQTLSNVYHKQFYELYKLAMNTTAHPDLLSWKYFENPSGNAKWVGLFYEDKLVGSGALLPEKMRVFSDISIVYKFTDLIIHPEHQGKGLSRIIIENLNRPGDGLCFTLCSKGATSGFIRNSWQYSGKFMNYFKPGIILQPFKKISQNNHFEFRLSKKASDILDQYTFREDFSRITTYKTHTYLDWRMHHPDYLSSIIGCYESGTLLGYLIYSVSGKCLFHIIDIEAINDNNEIISALLSEFELKAANDKAKGIIGCTISGTKFQHILQSKHYFCNPFSRGPLPSILDFNIKALGVQSDSVKDPKSWDIYSLQYDDM